MNYCDRLNYLCQIGFATLSYRFNEIEKIYEIRNEYAFVV